MALKNALTGSVMQFTLATVLGDLIAFIHGHTILGLISPKDLDLFKDKLAAIRPQPVPDVSFCEDLDAMETALRLREALGRIFGAVPQFKKYVYVFPGQHPYAAIYAEKRDPQEYVAQVDYAYLKSLSPMSARTLSELSSLIPKVDCTVLSGEQLGKIQNFLHTNFLSSHPRLISYSDLAILSHPKLSKEEGSKYTRSAATAMSKNPVLLLVPCHLVISKPLYDEFRLQLKSNPNAVLKDAGKFRLGSDIKSYLMYRFGINVKRPA